MGGWTGGEISCKGGGRYKIVQELGGHDEGEENVALTVVPSCQAWSLMMMGPGRARTLFLERDARHLAVSANMRGGRTKMCNRERGFLKTKACEREKRGKS